MANTPGKLLYGVRDFAAPGEVKNYKVVFDKKGNIKRDKAGNPVLGKRI